MKLDEALQAREVRIGRSALLHLAVREHQPRPEGRALVIYTACGIVAFEEPFEDAPRCPGCWPPEA